MLIGWEFVDFCGEAPGEDCFDDAVVLVPPPY
jgi:hypothetical protein